MKRTGFARPVYRAIARTFPSINPTQNRFVAMKMVSGEVKACPKDEPVRSEAYRRVVATHACKVCGIVGYSQAAHPNTGKGMGTKTDDRECFPLCCDRPGVRGCHAKFDQGALFTKEARRLVEQAWAADTRRAIEAAGDWPADLPKWQELEKERA